MKTHLLVFSLLCGLWADDLAAQSIPVAHLANVPSEAMIGSEFTFTITLENQGQGPGYIPYLEVCVDAGGKDLNSPCPNSTSGPGCDGLTIVSYSGDVDTGYNSLVFRFTIIREKVIVIRWEHGAESIVMIEGGA
jgi:hypothetical protein